jgi:hypothetical protein
LGAIQLARAAKAGKSSDRSGDVADWKLALSQEEKVSRKRGMAMGAKNLGCDVKERNARTLWPLLPLKGVEPFPVLLRFSMRSFDENPAWPRFGTCRTRGKL